MSTQVAQVLLRPEKTCNNNLVIESSSQRNGISCSLRKLQDIWENKEYRIFPKAIQRYMRQDTALSDAAIICWQTLFELAYFDEDWKITISKAKLAKEMRKSPSTISRLLDQLEQLHYIEVKHNKINKVWQISTISVRFPQKAMPYIQSESDRKKNNKNNNKHLITNEVSRRTIKLESTNNVSLSEDEHDNIDESTIAVLYESTKDTSFEIKNALSNKLNADERPLASNTDKGSSIFEYSINTNNNNNKNNNNVVVDLSNKVEEKCNSSKIQELESKLLQCEEMRKLAEQEWLTETDPKKIYDKIRRFGEVDATFQFTRSKLEYLKKQHQTDNQQQKILSKIEQNEVFVKNLEGERAISEFAFKRLLREIEKIDLHAEMKTRLINEIIFEVRFGSLTKCNGTQQATTQQATSVDHAINIALKLLREGRWSKPIAFEKFIGGLEINK